MYTHLESSIKENFTVIHKLFYVFILFYTLNKNATTKFEYSKNSISIESFMVKAKLSLCLISSALCHEDMWGSGGIAPPFLTLALDGSEWSASCQESSRILH
jgi:hypothetical protein